jgi:alpha-L-fucosidase
MKKIVRSFYLLAVLILLGACSNQEPQPPEPVLPVPTELQLTWHEMELNAFIHFTTNTFTNVEWGFGNESPKIFNPSQLDVTQWTSALKDAGFKGLILTCKHHDGFCLWPSKYTEHTVKKSPFQDGKGDIVKEVSAACKKQGLKFGVYLSPWDRNHAHYGDPEYIKYYRNQLTEIFKNYGPVFEMWFDGANGGDGYYGGANETRKIDRKTYYDWPTTISQVKALDSTTLFFSDAGPDIRWCGNESGYINETNWNTFSSDTIYAGKSGITELLNTGSESGNKWIPAEVNVSIRPGWFYHEYEDSLVKSPQQLFDIYLNSVGRGSVLLLNIPPDKRGLFHENDLKSLQGFRAILDSVFSNNLTKNAEVIASSYRGNSRNFSGENLIDNNKNSYWSTDDSITTGSVKIKLNTSKLVSYVVIQEYIKLGQRIKKFKIEAYNKGEWTEVAKGTTIGYKRILNIDPMETSQIRLTIEESEACPVISNLEIY